MGDGRRVLLVEVSADYPRTRPADVPFAHAAWSGELREAGSSVSDLLRSGGLCRSLLFGRFGLDNLDDDSSDDDIGNHLSAWMLATRTGHVEWRSRVESV